MVKIERSIEELLDLLQILNEQVLLQGQTLDQVAIKAEEATEHLGQANVQIEKGVQHARRARKLKWWCLGIVLLICIAIALGVGLGVALTKNATS
jgi:t-SNARE complex subunit, syntaxin